MKRLNISDSDVMEIALQNEILRSEDARYDHRLHGVLLVCRGFTSYEVAKMLIIRDGSNTVRHEVCTSQCV